MNNNDKFENFIKEKLNSQEYELIKKYSVNDITSKTNDITKWLYKMFSENQLPKTDLIINNSWFYCEIFEVYNKFVKKVASIFENKKGLLVSITIIIFGILASVVSEPLILIAFMPFIYKVMKELDVDKKVILSSTIIV